MIYTTARLIERYFNLPIERTTLILSRGAVILASAVFLLLATLIVAFDSLFPGQSFSGDLQIGTVVQRDILAPETRTYVSAILTNQKRLEAQKNVRPVYNSPDLNVARTQTRLAGQILDFIDNVRRDIYATPEQRIDDIQQISALTLDDIIISQLLAFDDETWKSVRAEVVRLLEQVMQEPIREVDLQATRDRLPVQVSLRFDDTQVLTIVAIVHDLVRVNTIENLQATESARLSASSAVTDETRSFQRGQIVVRRGVQIGELEYEALTQLGLLQPSSARWQHVGQALIGVLLAMVISGLYLARFRPTLLYTEPRLLSLMALIFLVVLGGARMTLDDTIYLFPSGLLALLYVAIVSPQIAVMGSVILAMLVGLMSDNSLEVTTLEIATGTIGALTLRRPERLNSYFRSGLLISLASMTVAGLFNLTTPAGEVNSRLPTLLVYGLFNGVLTAAATVVGLYLIGAIFNLPTALKLIELSQPSQPLLQRLLREAPGTYQHSLQVANLAEQAANAIGANATLVHVAALYHDIGKMSNAAFFTENQRDIGNPHDTLNDPYRSADIIIRHVTEGDDMAQKYRLPNRIRDFIREHHGTTQVYVFYKQAVIQAGDDEAAVDIADFTYPGPRPLSRETAILMLADSCEATIRATQPGSKQEIEEAIERVIEGKRKDKQLDESSLTLNDLAQIKRIFVDILKATFHPRINYSEAIAKARSVSTTPPRTMPTLSPKTDDKPVTSTPPVAPKLSVTAPSAVPTPTSGTDTSLPKIKLPERTPLVDEEDDSTPMPYVPLLPRTHTTSTNSVLNGTAKTEPADPSDLPPKDKPNDA